MAISAQDVKKLRDMTAAGMMECKKALEESDGDFEKAVELLRISGAAKAAKRGAERSANNGLVAAHGGALIALQCETDFVAKNEDFQALAAKIVEAVAANCATTVEAANALALADGQTVAEAIAALAGVIGEKLELGQVACFDGDTAVYLHKRSEDLPAQVGVLLSYTGSADIARAIGMQVAAMRPQFVTRDEVPAETVENEKRIAEATAREEGKPEAALPKIVEGRVNGFYKDVVLLEQPSVQDSKQTVKAFLEANGTAIAKFVRFEVAG